MSNLIKPKRKSRSSIIEIINNSKGKIMTIRYFKKDGSERVMNCNKCNAGTTKTGYILVNDMQEKGKRKVKSVDTRTIKELKFCGDIYTVK